MTLVCENANSTLLYVFIVADVDDQEGDGSSLVEILNLNICQDVEAIFVKILSIF